MPGGRFGGAGATARWTRPYGSRGGWSRSQGGVFTRRRPRISGGHSHIITSANILANTYSEDNPLRGAIPLLHPGYWLDRQWDSGAQDNYYEGTLESTSIYHAEFTLTHWPINYVSGVQLFVPFGWGYAVIPWYDSGGNAYPGDWYPSVLPYLFHRSFGWAESYNTPNDPTVNVPVQRARIIHRWWDLSEHTDLAFGQAGKVVRHKWTLRKRVTMRHNEALYLVYNAYNTHLTDTTQIGIQVAFTLGFTHHKRQ